MQILLTPKEVEEALQIGRDRFYELVNSGDLPAYRIGRLIRVSPEDLEKFKENHRDGKKN